MTSMLRMRRVCYEDDKDEEEEVNQVLVTHGSPSNNISQPSPEETTKEETNKHNLREKNDRRRSIEE